VLQRQINLLNKGRIEEVRKFATDIGETAAGVSDIRTNGGSRYRMSLFSDRLGKLYDIRFEIYQKKFFMKFLNNFINQLTPFFFYSVGGYLAITGHITVGALVAALAAFKDMSSPWKELLAYYNTTQDVALRWEQVTKRFASNSLVDDHLYEGVPDESISLKGDIDINGVTVRDDDGRAVLEDISLTIPQGARVAVKTDNEAVALAFADLLTREVIPQHGSVNIAGHDLNTIHQVTLANSIGYAHSNPHILQGTLGENLLMPFKNKPIEEMPDGENLAQFHTNAMKSGNSTDPFDVDWVDPAVAGLQTSDEIRDWWFQLVEAMGIDDFMVRRALRSSLESAGHQKLADAIVRLRPEIASRIKQAGLDGVVYGFHPDKFNPVTPLGSNLLYAVPSRMLTQLSLSRDKNVLRIIHEQGITDDMMQVSVMLMENLIATFGDDGTDHPLFRRLNLDEELYQRLSAIVKKRREVGDAGLSDEESALILTVPFAFSAEQIGPAFSDDFKQRVLDIRKTNADQLVKELDSLFETIDPDKYMDVMTIMDNALFGRISGMAGAQAKSIEDIIVDVISENGLRRLVAESIHDLVTSSGGDNLPTIFKERVAFSRAGIKKPNILILSNSLASHDSETRALMRERISKLLPDTTKIFIENRFANPESYDLFVEIVDGRIDGAVSRQDTQDIDVSQDLNRKIGVIQQADLFRELDRKQQRLLAFGSQWFKAEAGNTIFSTNEEADAAYLCVEGLAELVWTAGDGERRKVGEVSPGRLIGDLSIIVNARRNLDLVTLQDSVFLRIGATELMAVIENDAMVASSLLRSVSGHMTDIIGTLRDLRNYSVERGVDFSKFDSN
ncbi:MAG: cyclic nucleotide-binding domain-containing protein, partial [Gammaproteobacteria bacterium]|nr:cyclic nucleotide-binding domain-containing protein [Gammaproteobacteria bacterium]